jgi:prepilin-type N-terminal cleavage/methylation domain-containing protein
VARRGEQGFSLVELMIATVVLTVGLLALSGLLSVAILSNNRNKVDSTATMLAQAVVEQIDAAMTGAGDTHLTDCAGHDQAVSVTADGGARLGTDGKIDFTETTPPAGYSMLYVVCSTDPNTKQVRQTSYDVRWNIKTITGNNTYLVTAAAVVYGAPAPLRDLRVFAFPSNLRVLIGPEPLSPPSGGGS